MRYLITGGAGFIGSHLAELLLSLGQAVDVIDDFSTGSPANVAHLRENPDFACHTGSILDAAALGALMDRAGAVFHLAAAVGVKKIVDDPVGTIVTNISGTETVLELAAERGLKVVLASTSEVYGKSPQLPFSESGDLVLGCPAKPRWSYACSKAIDEFLALAYGKSRALPVAIARLFNTVGPRQTGRYGMVIPRFVAQGLAGEPIVVYGSGEQTRCFTHVRDVVGALRALMEEPRADGGIYNIGSREEISINRLAEFVRDRTGGRSEIRHISFAEAYDKDFEDMERRVPDLSRIAALTGYAPRLGLEAIVDDVVACLRSGFRG